MTNFTLSAFATEQGSIWGTLALVGIMLVFMYFFILRPQSKRNKQEAAMRDSLRIGDEITTIGGVIGKIVSMKEETITIETSKDRTKIRFLKTAVRNVDVKAEDALPSNTKTSENK